MAIADNNTKPPTSCTPNDLPGDGSPGCVPEEGPIQELPPYPHYDDHNKNRAIAYASVGLYSATGSTTWKEVSAFPVCSYPIPIPMPEDPEDPDFPEQPIPEDPGRDGQVGDPDGGVDNGDGNNGDGNNGDGNNGDGNNGDDNETRPDPYPYPYPCGGNTWEVIYTTQYSLVECPDGRPFITRSGSSVRMKGSTVESISDWSESVVCGIFPKVPVVIDPDVQPSPDLGRLPKLLRKNIQLKK